MTKLQLTLTTQEASLLSFKATRLGYNLARFVKFLISREAARTIEDSQIPTFTMSDKAEKVALRALEEYEKGKAEEVTSFKDLAK